MDQYARNRIKRTAIMVHVLEALEKSNAHPYPFIRLKFVGPSMYVPMSEAGVVYLPDVWRDRIIETIAGLAEQALNELQDVGPDPLAAWVDKPAIGKKAPRRIEEDEADDYPQGT